MEEDEVMKAVAGTISNTREMPPEEESQQDAEVLEAPPKFLPVITRMYGVMGPHLSELARHSPCFGHLWEDDEGVCPDAEECEIAEHCQSVYKQVTAGADDEDPVSDTMELPEPTAETVVAEPDVPVTSDTVEVEAAEVAPEPESIPMTRPAAERQLNKKPKREKGKWADEPKYERHGYFNMGRPVDLTVAAFVEALGNPPALPKNWSYMELRQKSEPGSIALAKTASYHTVIVEGKAVCRMWTNAAGYALVDLAPVLVAAAELESVKVLPIPPKSVAKLAPCTGRIYCKGPAQAEQLARWIIDNYSIGKAKKPARKTTKKKPATPKATKPTKKRRKK